MPFQSQKQKGWMFSNKPKLAKKFAKDVTKQDLPHLPGIADETKKKFPLLSKYLKY